MRARLITVPTNDAAGSLTQVGARQMTRSACLPASIDPISSSSPSACAALIVTALRVVGRQAQRAPATVMTSGNLTGGGFPG